MKPQFMLSSLGLILTVSVSLSCGTNPRSQAQLQSIAVSPATADGQVAQFVATGYYVNPSYTVTPQPATWGACYNGAPTTEVSVTTNGMAQCASGAAGNYTVFAFVVTNPACESVASNACGGGCTIVGSAQLTCP